MEEKNLLELEVHEGPFHVKLVRQSKHQPVSIVPLRPSSKKPAEPQKEDGLPVKAPIAGVFYRARSPQSPPFVNVGDVVTAEQPLCIIEAMKVMNEIVAGTSGRVVKIPVENGKPVEADQTLFIVKPD